MAPYLNKISSPTPESRTQAASAPVARADDLDDLFDYDVDLDDVFRDTDPPKPDQSNDTSRKGFSGGGLGIDEVVEVAKKPRAPRVKLDDDKLLSQAGIPRLRKRARDLKLKGKGHEYSDAARLLSFYQLWLDDLFPKARFLDALAMVEKLGHKKRMQMMRMEWINEGKPKEALDEGSIFDEPALPPRQTPSQMPTATHVAPIFEAMQLKRPKTPDMNEDPYGDIYDATPRAPAAQRDEGSMINEGSSLFGPRRTSTPDEPEDDLDVLLAEQEMYQTRFAKEDVGAGKGSSMPLPEEDFDDDMEAMAEMEMEGIYS